MQLPAWPNNRQGGQIGDAGASKRSTSHTSRTSKACNMSHTTTLALSSGSARHISLQLSTPSACTHLRAPFTPGPPHTLLNYVLHRCSSRVPSEAESRRVQRQVERTLARLGPQAQATTTPTNIGVYFHVVYGPSYMNANISQTMIDTQMNVLNAAYGKQQAVGGGSGLGLLWPVLAGCWIACVAHLLML